MQHKNELQFLAEFDEKIKQEVKIEIDKLMIASNIRSIGTSEKGYYPHI